MKAEDRPLLQPILDGQPFANKGTRNTAAWQAISKTAFLAPDVQAEDLVELFMPSLSAMAAQEPEGALTRSIIEPMVFRAIEDAVAKGRRGLLRGDDVELANVLLAGLAAEGHVVTDQGRLYVCEPDSLWKPVEDSSLSARLQKLAGARVGPADKQHVLHVSSRMVAGAITLAKAQVNHPGFFSEGPRGIAFSNGFAFVDGDAVRFDPLTPDHRALWRLPFELRLDATCPLFSRFLNDIFLGDEDAEEKKALLQEFVGAAILGIAPRYARALVLFGAEGRNGKSTFLSIIHNLVPFHMRQAVPPHHFDEDYHRIELDGVRLNLVNELPRADILRGEAFKSIVAGDPITGRRVKEAVRLFTPCAGHIFAANALPSVDDLSRAFWERLLVIEFKRHFAEHERDTTLGKRIADTELPGVASWAIKGAIRLLSRGPLGTYAVPASHTAAVDTWRRNSDQVALFVEEMTVPASDPDHRVEGAVLYAAYRDWAQTNGHRALRNGHFVERLRNLRIVSVKPKARTLYPLMLITSPSRFSSPGLAVIRLPTTG